MIYMVSFIIFYIFWPFLEPHFVLVYMKGDYVCWNSPWFCYLLITFVAALKLDYVRVIDTSYILQSEDGSIHKRPSLNNLCKASGVYLSVRTENLYFMLLILQGSILISWSVHHQRNSPCYMFGYKVLVVLLCFVNCQQILC